MQGKPDNIKRSKRILAFQRIQRQLQPLHFRFHIKPGHEGALAPPVLLLVQNFIQNFFAQEGHTNFIGVREAESKPQVHFILFFIYAARFAAGVTARLLHVGQRFFQLRVKHERSSRQIYVFLLYPIRQEKSI